MGTSGVCVVCDETVDWSLVREDFADILGQVDMFGPDSLTEKEQVVYNAMCCSRECFENLS